MTRNHARIVVTNNFKQLRRALGFIGKKFAMEKADTDTSNIASASSRASSGRSTPTKSHPKTKINKRAVVALQKTRRRVVLRNRRLMAHPVY